MKIWESKEEGIKALKDEEEKKDEVKRIRIVEKGKEVEEIRRLYR